MTKFNSFPVKLILTIVICITLFLLNSMHYKYQAHDRILQVIALQEADLSKARIVFDEYDYFESGYVMAVFYNDDPDIRYKYIYERPRNRVYVSAWLGNASLDLTNRKAKYSTSFHTFFDFKGDIKEQN